VAGGHDRRVRAAGWRLAFPPPAFDGAAIADLVRCAEACEAGWRDWGGAHAIKPFQTTYEDLTRNLDKAVRDVAGFFDVTLPPGLGRIHPRLQRQADHHTERFVRLFNSHASA
jgi:LPS sulfotransferase NodH